MTGTGETGGMLDMGGPSGFTCPEDPNLAACYLFDNETNMLLDGSSKGWHGSMTDVEMIPGHRGLAIKISSNSIVVGGDLTGPKGSAEWTMMAWVSLAAAPPQRAGVFNRDKDYGLFVDSMGIPHCTGNAVLFALKPLPLDTWTHLACVRSGGVTKIYVNGVVDAQAAMPAPVPPVSVILSIGNDSPPTPEEALPGAIDEVLLWSTALSQAEICAFADLPC